MGLLQLWVAGYVERGMQRLEKRRSEKIKRESWEMICKKKQQQAALPPAAIVPATPIPGIEWCESCGVQLSRAGHFCDQCGEVRQRNTEPQPKFTHSQVLAAISPLPGGKRVIPAARLVSGNLDVKQIQQIKGSEA